MVLQLSLLWGIKMESNKFFIDNIFELILKPDSSFKFSLSDEVNPIYKIRMNYKCGEDEYTINGNTLSECILTFLRLRIK